MTIYDVAYVGYGIHRVTIDLVTLLNLHPHTHEKKHTHTHTIAIKQKYKNNDIHKTIKHERISIISAFIWQQGKKKEIKRR